ncbi:polysaccharide biosynthesis tyrosine autokinase [soil metagenome]
MGTSSLHITGYGAVIRRWWWSLLIAAWMAGIAGFLVASTIPPTYETSARLLVGPINADLNTLRASGALAGTYSEIAMSRQVLDEALGEVGGPVPPTAVRATADEATRLIVIRVEHVDPAAGAAVANAITESLTVRSQVPTARPEGQITVVDTAIPATAPVAPRVDLITGLAAVTGLVAALLVILLAELLGDRVRDSAEIRSVGMPVLGTVLGTQPRRRDRSLAPVVEAAPDSRAAVSYHQLAGRLQILAQEQELRSVTLLGVDPGHHVGEVAVNTALVLGRLGRRVVLVDANREEREIDRLMRIAPRRGLASLLFDRDTDMGEAGVMRSGIVIIPYGISDQRDLISMESASNIVKSLASTHDLVVVAASSPERDPNSLVWARATQGVVLVLRHEHTRRRHLATAAESLRLAGSNITGAVLYRAGTRRQQSGRSTAERRAGDRDDEVPTPQTGRVEPSRPDPSPKPAQRRSG